MGHTIVGLFRHSGDAEMAAAWLREEYTLDADELDVIGQAEWDNLSPPAQTDGTAAWLVAAATGGVSALGDEDPVGKRWGDKVYQGETLVVARCYDPDVAQEIARGLRNTGAQRVDLLPH